MINGHNQKCFVRGGSSGGKVKERDTVKISHAKGIEVRLSLILDEGLMSQLSLIKLCVWECVHMCVPDNAQEQWCSQHEEHWS